MPINPANMTDRELLMVVYDRIERIDYVLSGNGKPGLVDRVSAIEDSLIRTEESAKSAAVIVARTESAKSAQRSLVGGIIAVGVSAAVSIFGAVVYRLHP